MFRSLINPLPFILSIFAYINLLEIGNCRFTRCNINLDLIVRHFQWLTKAAVYHLFELNSISKLPIAIILKVHEMVGTIPMSMQEDSICDLLTFRLFSLHSQGLLQKLLHGVNGGYSSLLIRIDAYSDSAFALTGKLQLSSEDILAWIELQSSILVGID